MACFARPRHAPPEPESGTLVNKRGSLFSRIIRHGRLRGNQPRRPLIQPEPKEKVSTSPERVVREQALPVESPAHRAHEDHSAEDAVLYIAQKNLDASSNSGGGSLVPTGRLPSGVEDLSWEELVRILTNTEWQPQQIGEWCEDYAEDILEGFGVHHIAGTQYILHEGTNSTICHCREGVFSFGLDFEYGCMLSKTVRGALRYIRTPGAKSLGPIRATGQTYNINGQDLFDPNRKGEIECE